MLADGGSAISDLALLRDQSDVFGPVASTTTDWRLLAGIGEYADNCDVISINGPSYRLKNRLAAIDGDAEVA